MAESPAAVLAARLAALQRDYLAQLPQRLAAVEAAWSRLAAGVEVQSSLHELHRLVHSLAGSGQTFGVAGLSEAARAVEQQLKPLLEAGDVPPPETLGRVQGTLAALRSVLRAPGSAPPPVPTPAVADGAPVPAGRVRSLFLVDDDPAFRGALAVQLGHYGYRVREFPGVAGLAEAVAADPPAALLLDEELPDGRGSQALGRLRQQGYAGAAVLLSDRGDMAVRLEAVRAGAAALFTKPVEVGELVERLDRLVDSPPDEPYRVLLVEDSVALAEFYRMVLEQAGMLVEVVHDPLQALPVLDGLGADLILTDIYMPGCSGLELAAVIRQQNQYLGIPIVFLSSESAIDQRLAALGLGADDFLTKPIEAGDLLRAVQNRAERSRALRRLMLHDSLTGVLNHSAATDRLEEEVARAERLSRPLALAVLDVDHFKSVNDSYGHLTGDRVLRSLARLLRQRLRRTDVIGRTGGEEFAVVMPDTTVEMAHRVIDALRASFAELEHEAGGRRLRATFSAGVAGHAPGVAVAALIEAADGAMYRAKQAGRNRVVTAP